MIESAKFATSDKRTYPYAMVPQELRSWIGRQVEIEIERNGVVEKEQAEVTIQAVMVYLGLAWHMNRKTGRCFPSFTTLARELKIGKSSVSRSVKILSKMGAISITQQKTEYGFSINHYDLIDIQPEVGTTIESPVPVITAPVPVVSIPGTENTPTPVPTAYHNHPNIKPKEKTKNAATPPPPPALGTQEWSRQQALRILRNVESKLRVAFGEANVISWGRDVRNIGKGIFKYGIEKIENLIDEDIAWRIKNRVAWDARKFFGDLDVKVQRLGIRRMDAEHLKRKREEQGFRAAKAAPAAMAETPWMKAHPGQKTGTFDEILRWKEAVKHDRIKEWRAAHPGVEPKTAMEIGEWWRGSNQQEEGL